MIITVYEIITGKILKIVISDDITYSFNPDTQFYLEGSFDGNKYYVDNKQLIEIPLKPNNYCEFDYSTKTWIDTRTIESQSNAVKIQRNELLYTSDWTQIPNNPLTADQQSAWATYRQELRDITSQSGYPFNVVWPTPPS